MTPHSSPKPAPRRLLIVDDDVDFAVSTSRVLALEGVDCALVHSGAEALARKRADRRKNVVRATRRD